jgi:hypothetical protein
LVVRFFEQVTLLSGGTTTTKRVGFATPLKMREMQLAVTSAFKLIDGCSLLFYASDGKDGLASCCACS